MSKTVRFGTLLLNTSDSVPFDIFLKAEFRTSFLNILINKKPPLWAVGQGFIGIYSGIKFTPANVIKT
jgi:hypothetical protein